MSVIQCVVAGRTKIYSSLSSGNQFHENSNTVLTTGEVLKYVQYILTSHKTERVDPGSIAYDGSISYLRMCIEFRKIQEEATHSNGKRKEGKDMMRTEREREEREREREREKKS